MLDVGFRAKLLGYIGAANVHVEHRVKKNPAALRAALIRLCSEIYEVHAETVEELASKIDDLGRIERRKRCRAYRATHGLPHPQQQKYHATAQIDDFPSKPQVLKLPQNQPGYVPPLERQTIPENSQPVMSVKKLRKMYLAARKQKRDARKERRRARQVEIESAVQVQRHTAKKSTGPTQAMIDAFYSSWDWKQLSYDVKLERGRKCECCGAKAPDVRIHTDHVKPLRHYWNLRLDRSNLQILCEDCNMGKGSRDETDFRNATVRPVGDDPETARQILDGPMPPLTVIWN